MTPYVDLDQGDDVDDPCVECDDTGRCRTCCGYGEIYDHDPCPDCDGTGRCPWCRP